VVPFGGAEHDWAALELASWIASSAGAPLKLIGAAGQTDDSKSVTRALADAGLVVPAVQRHRHGADGRSGRRRRDRRGGAGRRPAGDRDVRALAT